MVLLASVSAVSLWSRYATVALESFAVAVTVTDATLLATRAV